MEPSTSIKNAPVSQDLLMAIRTFISGATGSRKTNPLELTRIALDLLKRLPSARDAVLEYFCSVFDKSVSDYLAQTESGVNTSAGTTASHEELAITEIHSVLCSFVSLNAEAWAPIISAWSLELLGSLSSKYVGRAKLTATASLNESLHLWMSCRATRTLIDINTQCLSCLMHSNTEACINALLDTSVLHSPHFDWVVAHVGSSFPHTVITRVLSCGLKDFCQNQQGTSTKAPKINSVVGILGHLAGSHFSDIKTALLELFQWSLEGGLHLNDDKSVVLQRIATVPYLLQLASLSSTLLQALSADVLHSLNCEVLRKVCSYATDWCSYLGGRQALQELVVHLALNCSTGGDNIFMLLLDAAEDPYAPMSSNALEILELLLKEIGTLVRMRPVHLSILDCVKQNISAVEPLLLSNSPLRAYTGINLLVLLGWEDWNLLSGSLAFMLACASTDSHLANLIQLLEGNFNTNCLTKASTLSFSNWAVKSYETQPEQLWYNIDKLLRWELTNEHIYTVTMSSVRDNMSTVASVLTYCSDMKLAHAVARVLDRVTLDQQQPLSMQMILWIVYAVVEYFYSCLLYDDGKNKIRGVRTCCRLFTRLSNISTAARSAAIRRLIEGALTSQTACLFGKATVRQSGYRPPDTRLMRENLKQGTKAVLAQNHSSAFHTGVIGYGLRTPLAEPSVTEFTFRSNTRCLISAVMACCQAELLQTTLDAVINVALLLVELISPDVMYNGLPWPEEEFCKVTVERDLHICGKLKSMPVIWSLLQAIASYRPALCYCSVILRAVAATLLVDWSMAAQQRKGPGEDQNLIKKTVLLLETMNIGQLLPPPLSSLQEAIPKLSPHQVVLLLRECVWNYMRDHVPAPALFARDSSGMMWRDPALSCPPRQYTETFRLVLQRNISKLGQLYCQLFISSASEP